MSTFEIGTVILSEGVAPIDLSRPALDAAEILLTNLPFIITALVVIGAAFVTYRSNQKLREHEHENKISEFRHHWLQEVRETVSTLCKIIHEIQVNTVLRNISRGNERSALQAGDDSMADQHQKAAYDSYLKLIERRSEYYKVSSKLFLLFKKEEPSTIDVFKLIEAVKEDIYDFDKTDLDESKVNSIVHQFQDILTTEWNVTKRRSWQK